MNTHLHSLTPLLNVIDSRGLPIRQVAYWRSDISAPNPEARISSQHFDGAGHLVEQRDARLTQPTDRANLIRRCSLSGVELLADSVDAGWQAGLKDCAAQGLDLWDGRGIHWQYVFDEQLRLVEVREHLVDSGFMTHQRLSYGSHTPLSADHNQCGQLIRHDDPAGTVLFKNFAVTGEILQQTRHLVSGPAQPDWLQPPAQLQALLEPGDGATTRWVFNALGDLCEQIDAKHHRQRWHQNVSGQLNEVQLQLASDAIARVVASDIRYGAHGHAEHEITGNGVISSRCYRPADGRLLELNVRSREGGVVQALRYAYDPVGNVLSIENKAQSTRFYTDGVVEPSSRFGYDSLYQLIEASGLEAGEASKGPGAITDPLARVPYRQTYSYDAGGNLLALNHQGAQHHSHRLVAAVNSNRCLPVRDDVAPIGQDFCTGFDGNGNLLQLHPGQALSWNSRNQLHMVQTVVRDNAANDREHYLYAADGQRLRKIREAQTSGGSVVVQVTYLPGLELRTHSGTREHLHVISIQAGHCQVQVLHWQSEPPVGMINDSLRYTFTDHLGSWILCLGSGQPGKGDQP